MMHRLLLAILLLTATAATRAAQPDIVVFLSDDHSMLDSTPYGSTDIRTPNMQRLADQGMLFSHAFIASPACAPSRSALLTGLMPARNGAEANHTFKRDDVMSLPTVLKTMGYYTVALGKVAHGDQDGTRHGFDLVEERHGPPMVEKILADRDKSKPICLFVGTHEPHVPWPDTDGYTPSDTTLPQTFVDTPETHAFRARYYTDVTKADTWLGQLLDLVDQHLDQQNTLVMYTSDHGAQWPFSKWNLYDAGTRVPLIVRWPAKIPAGSRSDAMVQWIDILPTIIEFAGGTPPNDIDGKSFLPVLNGSASEHRDEIYTTHSGDGLMNVYPIRSVRTRNWKLIVNLHPEFAYTTHIDKAMAVDGGGYWASWFELAKSDPAAAAIVKRYHQRPAVELYDLQNDPLEQHNLAARPEQVKRVAELGDKLDQWMGEQGDKQTVFEKPRLLSDPASTQPSSPKPRPKRAAKGKQPVS